MAKRKVPSQASSGAETFSDSLVGLQFTNGSSQFTNANFSIDKLITEKDSKTFVSNPLSDFITLDNLKIEEDVPSTFVQTDGSKRPIRFNTNKSEASKSLYGSLRERIRVSINRILKNFPAGLYVDKNSVASINNFTAENVVYDITTNITTFTVQVSKIFNPYEILLSEPKINNINIDDNKLRKFYSAYTKYQIDVNGTSYSILNYVGTNINNIIQFEIIGNPFPTSGYTESYLIKPISSVVEEFFLGLDDLEETLLNRETYPIYQASFLVPRISFDKKRTDLLSVTVNWPVSYDGWNLQLAGSEFNQYIVQLNDLSTEIDNYKSNLVTRFLVAPQLFEFDTDDQKIDKIFQIYGQSFDKVKSYIDNIAYMRNVTYDGINNIPDVFLKNLATTLGLDTINLFDEKSFEEMLYTTPDTVYAGISTNKNLVNTEIEIYRRILTNLAYIYKSKGTRTSIEFFLKFLGAPEPLIKIDEFIYTVDSILPTTLVEDDIFDLINGVKINYELKYNTGTTLYDIITTTGTTSLTQKTDFPINYDTLLPKTPTTNLNNNFFQKGAGWYEKTLTHRSIDILDFENSILTGNVKTIITKSKPFTYGEDFYDIYRTLPGLDYGYSLTPKIDNKKGEVIDDNTIDGLILNRKNINIFLNSSRGVDYDIWKKSRELEVSFGSLEPQTNISFAEFLEINLGKYINNSNLIKYKNNYIQLEKIYKEYISTLTTAEYIPYDVNSVNDFINKMSPNWTKIIEQIIPATTLWLGGNLTNNSIFGRSKYVYEKSCQTLEIVENLYPDFETIITQDLKKFLGDSDNFRDTLTLSGVTYTLYLNLDGAITSGTTQVVLTGSTIFNPFTPKFDCDRLSATNTSIPLVNDYNDFINLDIPAIKTIWSGATVSLLNDINTQETMNISGCVDEFAPLSGCTQVPKVKLTYEIYTDESGVEKIKFISHKYGPNDCSVSKYFNFYFEASYQYIETGCNMRIYGYSPYNIYAGGSENCKLKADVYFTLSGFTANQDDITSWPVNVFYDCDVSFNQHATRPILTHASTLDNTCTIKLTDVYEDDQINLIFTDASNCEQKIRIDGLHLVPVYYDTTTGYTIQPKLQYRETFDYGLDGDSYVLKIDNLSVPINTWEDIASGITSSDIVKTKVSDILIGDLILSADYDLGPFTNTEFLNADTNGYSFSYNYSALSVGNKDCLGTLKTYFITGLTINDEYQVFEVLPTTKLRVYTNKDLSGNTITRKFLSKTPDKLSIKRDVGSVCCAHSEDMSHPGDYLLDQFGFPIEVIAVDLDYSTRNLYYHLNLVGNTLPYTVVVNGNIDTQIITDYTTEEFKNMDTWIDEYLYDPINCPTIPDITSNREYIYSGSTVCDNTPVIVDNLSSFLLTENFNPIVTENLDNIIV